MSQEISKGIWLHDCNRCGHKWTSYNETPGSCANSKCRSPYWNKKRER